MKFVVYVLDFKCMISSKLCSSQTNREAWAWHCPLLGPSHWVPVFAVLRNCHLLVSWGLFQPLSPLSWPSLLACVTVEVRLIHMRTVWWFLYLDKGWIGSYTEATALGVRSAKGDLSPSLTSMCLSVTPWHMQPTCSHLPRTEIPTSAEAKVWAHQEWTASSPFCWSDGLFDGKYTSFWKSFIGEYRQK